MPSFLKRKIRVDLTLASGSFGATLGNTVQIEGLRVECEIEKPGAPDRNKLKMKIFGMFERDMNLLTTLKRGPNAMEMRKNLVKVLVGDSSTPSLSIAFTGEVTDAWAVYSAPPELYFQVEALEGFYAALAPADPKGYKGVIPISTIMRDLAKQMGYSFEDHGVQTKISNPYLIGTPYQQAAMLADAAGVEFGVDDGRLFIAPRGASRGTLAPLISAETGLREYPTFSKKGLALTTLFNPAIQLGGLIKVESAITVANGTWRVNGLTHKLDCESPNGRWETSLTASDVGS